MTSLQKFGYTSLAGVLTATQLVSTVGATALSEGETKYGAGKITAGTTGTTNTIDVAVQKLIQSFLTILGVIAVCYGIYAGFLMLTAGGDEEKVKKGRTIMIQVAIGLVVIFIANAIVRWFLGAIVN